MNIVRCTEHARNVIHFPQHKAPPFAVGFYMSYQLFRFTFQYACFIIRCWNISLLLYWAPFCCEIATKITLWINTLWICFDSLYNATDKKKDIAPFENVKVALIFLWKNNVSETFIVAFYCRLEIDLSHLELFLPDHCSRWKCSGLRRTPRTLSFPRTPFR